jgi:hypothetical protein
MWRTFGVLVVCVLLFQDAGAKTMIDTSRAFKNIHLRDLADAARDSDLVKIEKLVRDGVPVNGIGEEGFRPLHWALMGKQADGLRRLLELGADPNAELANGRSPVFMAAALESPEFLELLLKYGGNPNGKSSSTEKRVALHQALFNKRPANAKLLLQAGADPDVTSANMPIVVNAVDIGNYTIAAMLLRGGASVKGRAGELLGESVCDTVPRPASKNYATYVEVVKLCLERNVKLPCKPLGNK